MKVGILNPRFFSHRDIHDYQWLRLLVPLLLIPVGILLVYYGRAKINRLFREEKIGYHPEKKNKGDDAADSSEKSDFDYSNVLNTQDDDRPIVGKTDRYEWSQTPDEIEVFIPLSKYGDTIAANELDVLIQPKKLRVTLRREVLFDEEFSRAVNVDESCWMVDNNTVGEPHIWMNLTKSVPTVRSQHWSALFRGGPEVNVRHLGPPVRAVDPTDKDSLREALRSVSPPSPGSPSPNPNPTLILSFSLPAEEPRRLATLTPSRQP
jgi:hypothetical protein